MSERESLRVGAEQPYGETTCGYGLDRALCSAPAIWHIFWLGGDFDGHTSSTCAEHLEYINSRSHPAYDIHTHGPNCGMPGTHWQFPYKDQDEGYCFFPANDDMSAIEVADVPTIVDVTA